MSVLDSFIGSWTDKNLESRIDELPNYTSLVIYGAGFTDYGAELLARCSKLRELQLVGTRITDEGRSRRLNPRNWVGSFRGSLLLTTINTCFIFSDIVDLRAKLVASTFQDKQMNPLRAIFISLSRMPPAMMLLIIIGLAVLVTMITGKRADQEQRLSAQTGNVSSAIDRHEMKAPVMVSTKEIKEGTTIDSTMIEQHRLYESKIFEDSIVAKPNAVGRVAKHTIPPQNQIREIDLQ